MKHRLKARSDTSICQVPLCGLGGSNRRRPRLGDRELDSPPAAAAFSGEPHFGALRWFAMRPREYLIGSSDCGGIPGFYDDTLHIAAEPYGEPSRAERRCDDES